MLLIRTITCKMCLISTHCEIEDIQYYMKCFMKKVDSLLHVVLYWESMIVGGGSRRPPKIGSGQRKLSRGHGQL